MNQVLVVTGGSQGIGAACARLAAARGYAVAISYLRAEALAQELAAEIRSSGGQAIAVPADGAQEGDVVRFFETVDAELGRCSALVNNAGITGPVAPVENITTAILDEVFGINVRGAFLALREAVLRMATDRGGTGGAIVNISSRAAALGGAGEWVHYAASKAAVDTLTIGAAKELASRGIRVNAVSPGLIATEIHAKAGMPGRAERMGANVPLGRAGTAEEVARTVLWLLSEEASYITSANVPVSGGR
ncbi:MAG: SDR family oxidoreductase [Acetobacteraceae bacterium]|nr:SDR family oxidoreductase [Acetobacteraceae bacterium]